MSLEKQWVEDAMLTCVRTNSGHWRKTAFIENEEEVVGLMMRKWDSCKSLSEMLRVRVGKVSVFDYQATLATWFFGLHLVYVKTKPNGARYLEIL